METDTLWKAGALNLDRWRLQDISQPDLVSRCGARKFSIVTFLGLPLPYLIPVIIRARRALFVLALLGTGCIFNANANADLFATGQPSDRAAYGQSSKGAVFRFDAVSGELLKSFGRLQVDDPLGVTFGPDGYLYVASGRTNQILRYDAATGDFKGVFASGGELFGPLWLRFGPDSNLYVTSSTGGVRRYNGRTGAFMDLLDATRSGETRGLAFDQASHLYVAENNTGNVVRYDISTGAFLGIFLTRQTLLGYGVQALAFGPNGNLYLTANALGRSAVFECDRATGKLVRRLVSFQDGGFSGLAFGPKGDIYVANEGIPNGILRFDGATGAYLGVFVPSGVEGFVSPYDLTFTPMPARFCNMSTRVPVETGEDALIGGFVISGSLPKKVIVRAMGPSLAVKDSLADPILELHDSSGRVIAINDNWQENSNALEIIDDTVAPTNPRESAILMTLNPSGYTAVVRGVGDTRGIALVEVYVLGGAAAGDSKLANISGRGFVQATDNVLIGGLIVTGDTPAKVLVRAIGPSLSQSGIGAALSDPTLELHDGEGTAIASNDNWKNTQQAEIEATTIPPTNDLESAIVATLPPGPATAIVRGVNNTTGVGLVEVYNLP